VLVGHSRCRCHGQVILLRLSYAVAVGVVIVDDCVMVGRSPWVEGSSCGGISVGEGGGP